MFQKDWTLGIPPAADAPESDPEAVSLPLADGAGAGADFDFDDFEGPASSVELAEEDPPHFPNPKPTARGDNIVAALATDRACS